jgi:uncharacterized protein YuzE
MKVKYDRENDVLTIRFSEKKIVESDEVQKGVIMDLDESGLVVGIEILDASKMVEVLTKFEYEMTT